MMIMINDDSKIYPFLFLAESTAIYYGKNEQFKNEYEKFREDHGIRMAATCALQKIGLFEKFFEAYKDQNGDM